jgi:hypothetical protein
VCAFLCRGRETVFYRNITTKRVNVHAEWVTFAVVTLVSVVGPSIPSLIDYLVLEANID